MDTVLLQQFEEYLTVRGITTQGGDKKSNAASGKRNKRSVTPIADTLSSEEVLRCLFH